MWNLCWKILSIQKLQEKHLYDINYPYYATSPSYLSLLSTIFYFNTRRRDKESFQKLPQYRPKIPRYQIYKFLFACYESRIMASKMRAAQRNDILPWRVKDVISGLI